MCIIVYRPPNVKLDDQLLINCFENNPEGAGFSVVDNGVLVTSKGYFKKDQDRLMKHIKKHEGKEMLIHFRVASPGMVENKANCHPFTFDTGPNDCEDTEPIMTDEEAPRPRFQFAVAHNGRLPYTHSDKLSDTALFVKEVLRPILTRDPFAFNLLAAKYLLQATVGVRNKLVIMRWDVANQKSDVIFINKPEGILAHGCWMSNSSYLKRVYNAYDDDDQAWAGRMGYRGDSGRHTGYGYNGNYDARFHTLDKDGWYYDSAKHGYIHLATKCFAATWQLKEEQIAKWRKVAEEVAGRGRSVVPAEGAASSVVLPDDPHCLMAYLGNPDKIVIRKAAYNWATIDMGTDHHSTLNDCIHALRDTVREINPDLCVTDKDCDEWCLGEHYMGHSVCEEIEKLRREIALKKDKQLAAPLADVVSIMDGLPPHDAPIDIVVVPDKK